jgi:hypothetical protein
VGTFRLTAVLVQVGDCPVQYQQKQDTQPEPRNCREKGPLAHILRLFHGGDQQTPDRCRHHDTRRKAGQGPLNQQIHSSF